MLEHCIFHHRQAHLQSSRPHLLATIVSDIWQLLTTWIREHWENVEPSFSIFHSKSQLIVRIACSLRHLSSYIARPMTTIEKPFLSFFLRAHNFQVVREENLTDFSWRDAFPSEGEINHKWCIHLLLVMKLFPRHVILRSLFLDKRYKNRPKKSHTIKHLKAPRWLYGSTK